MHHVFILLHFMPIELICIELNWQRETARENWQVGWYITQLAGYHVWSNGQWLCSNILPVFVGVWSCDGMKVENNREIAARIRDAPIPLSSDSTSTSAYSTFEYLPIPSTDTSTSHYDLTK